MRARYAMAAPCRTTVVCPAAISRAFVHPLTLPAASSGANVLGGEVSIREGGSALQGHIRTRGPAGSWEYILDVGRYGAQRCQDCGRHFWIERRPKESCPACGGELRETEERRRETKGGFASRKDC
jgi:hypothetical protein